MFACLLKTPMESGYQACLNRLVSRMSEDPASSHTGHCFDNVTSVWQWRLRLQAIRKGLEFIYVLSKDPEVFATFGNDIIQCFYDLSKVQVAMGMESRYRRNRFAA